jgi:hypothetical protein
MITEKEKEKNYLKTTISLDSIPSGYEQTRGIFSTGFLSASETCLCEEAIKGATKNILNHQCKPVLITILRTLRSYKEWPHVVFI